MGAPKSTNLAMRKELAKVVLLQSRTARALPPHKLLKVVHTVDNWLVSSASSSAEYGDISTLQKRFHAFVRARHGSINKASSE